LIADNIIERACDESEKSTMIPLATSGIRECLLLEATMNPIPRESAALR
jgi:hypothetical protein